MASLNISQFRYGLDCIFGFLPQLPVRLTESLLDSVRREAGKFLHGEHDFLFFVN